MFVISRLKAAGSKDHAPYISEILQPSLPRFVKSDRLMHRKHSVQSIVLGKDTFSVTVYPHVDYAFIVALVVVLEEINEDRDD
ncbi:hypothetical protein C3L33_20540, partial [Rhododendron williamsianum]